MQGLMDGVNEDNLFQILDKVKKIAHSEKNESDDAVTSQESQIDAEEVDLNQSEIKNIYVSFMIGKIFCRLLCFMHYFTGIPLPFNIYMAVIYFTENEFGIHQAIKIIFE